jgi:MarR family transcriptional regulator, transcriptional regulator for hemolysin
MTQVRITDSLAYHVYRCARLLRVHFMAMGAREGMEITQEQWFVLNKLAWEDGQTQTALGDSIFSDRPNLTRILATMENNGWIRRVTDSEDARKTRVHLTVTGRKLEERFAALVPEARKRLFKNITKDDLETVMRVLEQMETNITDETE